LSSKGLFGPIPDALRVIVEGNTALASAEQIAKRLQFLDLHNNSLVGSRELVRDQSVFNKNCFGPGKYSMATSAWNFDDPVDCMVGTDGVSATGFKQLFLHDNHMQGTEVADYSSDRSIRGHRDDGDGTSPLYNEMAHFTLKYQSIDDVWEGFVYSALGVFEGPGSCHCVPTANAPYWDLTTVAYDPGSSLSDPSDDCVPTVEYVKEPGGAYEKCSACVGTVHV
jgi:hypothetical protein